MTDSKLIARGHEAEAALGILDEAYKSVMADLIDGWLESRPEEAELRERIYYMTRGMSEAVRKLATWRDTGKLEEERRKHDDAKR